jgi:hypothetical protein
MHDGCEYPNFKYLPSDINLNLGFFDDYASSILPLASFNTDSIKLISSQNISFMHLVFDKNKYTSRIEFDFNKIKIIG